MMARVPLRADCPASSPCCREASCLQLPQSPILLTARLRPWAPVVSRGPGQRFFPCCGGQCESVWPSTPALGHTAQVQTVWAGRVDPWGSQRDSVVQGGPGCGMEPHSQLSRQPGRQHAALQLGQGEFVPTNVRRGVAPHPCQSHLPAAPRGGGCPGIRDGQC